MKATELLKSQHEKVKELFKSIQAASGRAEKSKLFEEVAMCLVAHDAIEREIFYPACEKHLGMTGLLGEALVEHGVVEFCIHVADGARGGGDFDHKIKVLCEAVQHHVTEEEHELFPQVEKALSAELLEKLAEKLQVRFEETMQVDFRGPLKKRLEAALAGASSAHAKKTAMRPKTATARSKASEQRT